MTSFALGVLAGILLTAAASLGVLVIALFVVKDRHDGSWIAGENGKGRW